MDRRQRKTRMAIFEAFCHLLSKQGYEHITVSDIISEADVGRATFYSHFETKDFLLRELCEELFCHIFDCATDNQLHSHIFKCDAKESIFLHLLEHLHNNDNQIRALLCTQNNTLFLRYFKEGLRRLTEQYIITYSLTHFADLPHDYVVNHITSTFVETVAFWSKNNMQESPEEINRYFMTAIGK